MIFEILTEGTLIEEEKIIKWSQDYCRETNNKEKKKNQIEEKIQIILDDSYSMHDIKSDSGKLMDTQSKNLTVCNLLHLILTLPG